MSVRLLDWQEALDTMPQRQQAVAVAGSSGEAAAATPRHAASGTENATATHDPGCLLVPPSLPAGLTFERIIGSEVMYEVLHAVLVAAVIQHRLALGGMCLLSCAVRDQVRRHTHSCLVDGWLVGWFMSLTLTHVALDPVRAHAAAAHHNPSCVPPPLTPTHHLPPPAPPPS